MNEHLHKSFEGGVLTLRLTRPEKKNALTRAMYDGLAQGLRVAATHDETRVVIIAGGADFTAGNDLSDFAAVEADKPRPGAAFEFLEEIRAFPKPVVAAVRGVAVGIGTTMLLHCDAVVVAKQARLQMPFARLALVPEGGSSLLLAQRVGTALANWWLMSGEAFSGEEAMRAGLALRSVEDAQVEAEAVAIAGQLAGLPPGALAETKRLLRAPMRAALEAVMAEERVAFSQQLRSPEAQAVFAAFLTKKK
jgi:enoyl-CoA hydratase/carnithine racemase